MISTQRWQSSARLLWLAVSLLFAFDIHAAEKAKRPPNIIFILADDLGYGDLGCYGQKRIRTPHLDKLAADGIRFTQAYAGSTVCAPSRSCLMTGQHTGHTRIRGNALVPLRPEDQTVAELLKTAGYTTGLVGKWGLGEPDTTGTRTGRASIISSGILTRLTRIITIPIIFGGTRSEFPYATS